MKILLTGACGFVGSHIAEELIPNEIVALDCLTYAGRLDRLSSVRKHVKFINHDFRLSLSTALLKQIGDVDYIIHCGAESHVPRSFENPRIFVESNTIGTLNILEAARTLQPAKFLYVSTDEVFGPAREKSNVETDTLSPTNPYAATKASGELLVYSYFRSFGLPTIITRCMNMFGERQHPEKFIPNTIRKVLRGEIIQIHGKGFDGKVWISGSRHWLHASDYAKAISLLLKKGVDGETYHLAGEEKLNSKVARSIIDILCVGAKLDYVESSRPIHDLSYKLDDNKIRSLGWSPTYKFKEALENTVSWTLKHQEFLEE